MKELLIAVVTVAISSPAPARACGTRVVGRHKLVSLQELKDAAAPQGSQSIVEPPTPKASRARATQGGRVRGFSFKRADELFNGPSAKRVGLEDLKKLEGAWRLDAQVGAHSDTGDGIYSREGLRWYGEEERRLVITSGYHPYEERLRIEAKGDNLHAGELSGASPSECDFKDGSLACPLPLVEESFNLSCRLIQPRKGPAFLLCHESLGNFPTGYKAFARVKR